MPVHNSMDALAAAALSYDYDEGPKLVSYFFIIDVDENLAHLAKICT